jgi:hypothetical protein
MASAARESIVAGVMQFVHAAHSNRLNAGFIAVRQDFGIELSSPPISHTAAYRRQLPSTTWGEG